MLAVMSAELLLIGRLAPDREAALARVDLALGSGAALERFARMVAALGGPADFCERAAQHLVAAPVVQPVPAPRSGWVRGMATRDIGLAVVELGGGRRRANDAVDHRVGYSQLVGTGQRIEAGEPLALVHAASGVAADAAGARLASLVQLGDAPPARTPVLIAPLEG
jgi:thymidine phosphorylase